jgi:hypothetical protein
LRIQTSNEKAPLALASGAFWCIVYYKLFIIEGYNNWENTQNIIKLMMNSDEIATKWRDYYTQKALTARDKRHYEQKAAYWNKIIRFINLDVIEALLS